MNLQTLISYKEFCFLGRTRAATNGPDEPRRAQQGGGTTIPLVMMVMVMVLVMVMVSVIVMAW